MSVSSDDVASWVLGQDGDTVQSEGNSKIMDEERNSLVQELYEGERQCQCCINWVETMPQNVKTDVVHEEEHSHPLLLRHSVQKSQARSFSHLGSIEVHHADTRAVLLEVFTPVATLFRHSKHLKLKSPFHPFYWCWDRFEAAIDVQDDEYVRSILLQLRNIVKPRLASAFAVHDDLLPHGLITFDHLWMLFAPGSLLYSNDHGNHRFYSLLQFNTSPTGRLGLVCKFVDWDGSWMGMGRSHIQLDVFDGPVEITSLKVYPVKYLVNYLEIRAHCLERGRKMVSLAGVHYKAYQRAEDSDAVHQPARIIIDAASYPQHRRPLISVVLSDVEIRRGNTPLVSQAAPPPIPAKGHTPLIIGPNGAPILPQTSFGMHPTSHAPGKPPPPPPGGVRPRVGRKRTAGRVGEKVKNIGKLELTDLQLQLCNPRVLGYGLADKTWRSYEVDRICDITWNTSPFDSLVLPDGYKDLIFAFVQSQLRGGEQFEDVIQGKGGGLVILLAGEPGVGKTMTAESVAEKIQAPLYRMTLGKASAAKVDRGASGSDSDGSNDSDSSSESSKDSDSPAANKALEKAAIATHFSLAARWKAVLLLDECDMWLGKRSDASSTRNRIVNRFLQKLEYYPLLLFLTTNREHALDPAVQSRVHLTINYPALDKPSRRAVWATCLFQGGSLTVNQRQLDRLADIEMNGRRIRNITKTASIMATAQRRAVSFSDITQVMRITEGLHIDEPFEY